LVIESLPDVLSQTRRVCSSIQRGVAPRGDHMDAIHQLGHVLLEIAAATADQRGFRLRQAGDLCQHARG